MLSQCAVWVLMARVWVLRVRVLCMRVRVLTKGLESESESLKYGLESDSSTLSDSSTTSLLKMAVTHPRIVWLRWYFVSSCNYVSRLVIKTKPIMTRGARGICDVDRIMSSAYINLWNTITNELQLPLVWLVFLYKPFIFERSKSSIAGDTWAHWATLSFLEPSAYTARSDARLCITSCVGLLPSLR